MLSTTEQVNTNSTIFVVSFGGGPLQLLTFCNNYAYLLVVAQLFFVDDLVELSAHEVDVTLEDTVVFQNSLHVFPALGGGHDSQKSGGNDAENYQHSVWVPCRVVGWNPELFSGHCHSVTAVSSPRGICIFVPLYLSDGSTIEGSSKAQRLVGAHLRQIDFQRFTCSIRPFPRLD